MKLTRLVGFVLPCNADSLPLCDTYKVDTFEAIESAFKSGVFAKNAFVYMVQPLTKGVPAFCLACLGSDNKFSAELVLNRWKYIYQECEKRGISVASFGADGDSRELRAMQVSTLLCLSSRQLKRECMTDLNLPKVNTPSDWSSWFAMKYTTSVAFVQDTVHVAVKMKARLLKPSIVLPLGRYVAGAHDLKTVQYVYGKDVHGMRERDINHKDRQNFDAVLHLTSESVLKLLSEIPSAKGTKAYLLVIKSVTDSFIDKSLDPISRLEKSWFAVFFVRYWRWWVLHTPSYSLGSNFITTNAYVCIELNAHALIIYLLSCRDSHTSEVFLPWKLGSQPCEKVFRAARSMTSTFSTVINFGMLGLLRRLHRLHTQLTLESEAIGIKYPNLEAHKKKEGCNVPEQATKPLPTNEEVHEAVMNAKKKAQKMIEDLGMAQLLKEKKCWDYPPIPQVKVDNHDKNDDDEDDVDDEAKNETGILDHEETITSNDPSDLAAGINDLASVGVIDEDLRETPQFTTKSNVQTNRL